MLARNMRSLAHRVLVTGAPTSASNYDLTQSFNTVGPVLEVERTSQDQVVVTYETKKEARDAIEAYTT